MRTLRVIVFIVPSVVFGFLALASFRLMLSKDDYRIFINMIIGED
jgi:hypothetical protein